MFVQVIQGRVADREGLRRQFERWTTELRPGAKGFLGSTAGVTDGGDAYLFARFASAADAKANSERSEQGQWWAETEKCFDGEVRFADAEEVDEFLGGGSDDAGFVQVMKGERADRRRLRALDDRFEEHAATWRPDLRGGFRAWTGADSYVEVAYFTSDADARVGEATEPPAALADQAGEFEELMAGVEFIDLHRPWFS